jgi:hypothetical protein
MLLREYVRELDKEQFIANDTSVYGTSVPTGWATKWSKSFTITDPDQALLWSFKWLLITSSSSASKNGIRARIGNTVLWEFLATFPSDYAERNGVETGIVRLPPGSYTFYIDVRVDTAIYYIKIMNIRLGLFKLHDCSYQTTSVSAVSCGAGATTSVLSTSITKKAKRRMPLGFTKKTYTFECVTVESDGNVVVFKNPGESNDANALNVRLFVNGVEVGWTRKVRDALGSLSSEPEYISGRRNGDIVELADSEGSISIEVKVYNGYTVAKTVNVYLQVYSSVWLMPSSLTDMVELDVPFQSTIYIVSEPLWDDPTKTFALGYAKAWSTVFNQDNYYSASGTGILTVSYTFDLYPSRGVPGFLKWSGEGASITFIVADVR